MGTNSKKEIYFGPFEVTDQVNTIISHSYKITNPKTQVFYETPLSYALVNIKPILPGHTLVIPFRRVQRLTDLTPPEISDLFTLVQRVERMLAKTYFPSGGPPGTSTSTSTSTSSSASPSKMEDNLSSGSFNIAIQDGVESGQTVPHVHCHVIPRTRESAREGDQIYGRLQGEEGNVGGGFWDSRERPRIGPEFPRVEEGSRKERGAAEMNREAAFYREQMELVD